MFKRFFLLVVAVLVPISSGTLDYVGGENLILPFQGLSAHAEVFVEGQYAYVLLSDYVDMNVQTPSLLFVVDVSNPSTPTTISSVELPPDARGIVVRDGYAYVGFYNMTPGRDDDGFRIIDVRNPLKLIVIGGEGLSLPGHGQGVQIQGNYAYMSFFQDEDGGNKGFRAIYIANPSNPVVVGGENLLLPKHGRPVFVSGEYAYLPFYQETAGYEGLLIVSLHDPSNPVVVGGQNLFLPAQCRPVFVSGGYAYLGCEGNESEASGLFAINISNPESPVIVDVTPEGTGSGPEIFVDGNHLYTGGDLWDVSVPSDLKKLAAISPGHDPANGGVWGVFVSGDYLYLGYQGNATCVVQDALRIFKSEPKISWITRILRIWGLR